MFFTSAGVEYGRQQYIVARTTSYIYKKEKEEKKQR
jgi:hypothetical protein